MTRSLYTLFSTAVILAGSLSAQSSAGTEFWLGYMENLNIAFNDPPAFSVVVSTDVATTGSVDLPASGLSVPFTAGVGTTEVFLPDGVYYSNESEQIDNQGIRITTADPVRIQAFHYRLYFAESSNVLPTSELGTDYRVTAILDESGLFPTSLVIVATADNTEIEITPTSETLALRPAGVPFTVTLDAGQNYQVQAVGELSGTRVRSISGQPIAVFSGAQQANIDDGFCPGGADSHVWDQSLPLTDWRNLYYFVPFSGQGGDRIRVLAAEDNTRVFFDCEQVATLSTGEFHEAFLTEATVVSSTAPVSLTQYTNSGSCEPSQLGDPNALSYLPADFRATNFRWLSSGRPNAVAQSGQHFDQHFLTIVAPADATAGMFLDGSPLADFMPFPADPNWEYAQVQLSAGAHELVAAEAVQVYSYGFGYADSYTSHLGYTTVSPEEFACLDIDREGVLCVDSLQQFTYSSSLDLVSFNWSFGDGGTSTLPEPNYTYTVPGLYEVTLTATASSGLQVTASLEIEVADCEDDCADLPPLSIVGPDQGCVDSIMVYSILTDATLVSFVWDQEGTIGNNDTFPVAFSGQGTRRIRLTALDENGCVYMAVFDVRVEDCDADCADLSIAGFGTYGELCVDSTFMISAGITTSIGYRITWTVLETSEMIVSPIITQDAFPGAGTYEVDYLLEQQSTSCFLDTTITVTIEDCPPDCSSFQLAEVTASGPVCADSLRRFTASFTTPPTSISWQVPGLPPIVGETAKVVLPAPGVLPLGLQAAWENGCTLDTTLLLDVQPCLPPLYCKLMIPNIFSPNRDGVNDGFQAYFDGICTPAEFTFEVYDRWGSLVYQTNDPTAAWDGNYQGKPYPPGVLVYWCEAVFANGEVWEGKGDVTLIR